MPRRILKSKFTTYLFFVSLPLWIVGLLFVVKPLWILPYMLRPEFREALTSDPFFDFILFCVRFLGVMILFFALTIFISKREPGHFRDLIFWQAIFFFTLTTLLASGYFYFQLSYWVFIPAVIFFISGGFLMSFASRNLLIRE